MKVDLVVLEDWLNKQKALLSLHEAYGLLCGSVTAVPKLSAEVVQSFLMVAGDVPSIKEQDLLELSDMFKDAYASLEDVEVQMELCLPDDHEPLSIRLLALCNWVRGFLMGFAANKPASEYEKDEQVMECIADLEQISNLEVEVESTEEDEKSFFEVEEYVRMMAIFLYTHVRQNESK